jgi:mannose-1-phosphate guanylyltransferase
MTMMIFRIVNHSSCGIVELYEWGVVIEFNQKVDKLPGKIANGTLYILSANLLDLVATKFLPKKTEVLNRFMGRIYSYENSDVFLDVGTPETYETDKQLDE